MLASKSSRHILRAIRVLETRGHCRYILSEFSLVCNVAIEMIYPTFCKLFGASVKKFREVSRECTVRLTFKVSDLLNPNPHVLHT